MKKLILPVTLSTLLFMGSQTIMGATSKPATNSREQVITNPDKALELLKQGNQRFVNNKSLQQDLSLARREELKKGQFPFATIVNCSDSRVVSPYVFDQGLGDLFEVKLAGNIVEEEAMGSIEFGAAVLNIPLIVVLAHESCGAVHSTVDINNNKMSLPKESSINNIVERITPSFKAVKAAHSHEKLNDIEFKELVTVENAKAMKAEILKNPTIRSKVDKNEIKVVVATYMLNGTIVWE